MIINRPFKFALVLITGLVLLQPVFSQESEEIEIVVTTDIHGALFPGNWYHSGTIPGSMAQVAYWVNRERKQGKTLILLDNGDLIQGDPAVYYANYIQTTHPNIAARILNYMHYDAGTVGNHDLEAGHAVYDAMVKQLHMPWMAANALKTPSGIPYFEPFTIINRAGIKVAVIGLTTPKVPDWLPPSLWSGIKFADMIETARKWVGYVQKKYHPDLLIGLFHSGVDPGYNNASAGDYLNENASRLVAEQVPGFQIVFAGHDHRHHEMWVVNTAGDSVLLLDSKSRAREISIAGIHLIFTSASNTRVIKKISVTGTHASMQDIPPDSRFMDHFQGYIDSVSIFINQPVATLTEAINSEAAYFGPNTFIDLIHKAQLDLTGADISFAAPLSFRSYLPAGLLRVKSLFSLYRYENLLYTMKLTGREILDYLNYSYALWMNHMEGPDDPLLRMEKQSDSSWRFKSAYYNFDAAAGIEYTVDVTREKGDMVQILRMADGIPFDPDKYYTVALNSYRGSGGGGHLTRGAKLDHTELQNRVLSTSKQDFRYLLMQWMKQQKVIKPDIISRWRVVPEAWIKTAAARDRQRLFGRQLP